jgi:hypothetical protein
MANLSSRYCTLLAALLLTLCGSHSLAEAAPATGPAPQPVLAGSPPTLSPPSDLDSPASSEVMLLAAEGVASSATSSGACTESSAPSCQENEERPAPEHKSEEAKGQSAGNAAGGTTAGQWPYRRASIPEYLFAAGATAGTLYIERANGKPEKANWTARNDFDEGIRDALRLGNRDARDVAHMTSNILMASMIAAPVVESFAVHGVRDSHWDVMWQTQMINLESFTFTGLVSSVMQNFIARERPFVRNCAFGVCEGIQENRSMPSGHVAFGFAGAGLLCTHHKYQNYYNSQTTDTAICASGLAVATLDGLLRIVSDRHYATDVLAGTAIGLFSGFILPRIFHYPWSGDTVPKKAEADDSFVKQVSFAPEVYADGGGLRCAITF